MMKHILYLSRTLAVIAALVIITGVKASEHQLSPSTQVQLVESEVVTAKFTHAKIQNLVKVAKTEKDTIKITCLEDKLAQISASLRGVEERSASFKKAHNGGKTTEANQHLAVLEIYISRIYGLRAEAGNCIGETDIVLGNTETTVEIDGDPNVDPSREDKESGDIVDPSELDHASGYY